MEFKEVVKNRFSCKKYSSRKLEPSKLEAILEAGRLAPTAKNLQEQHVYVVQSEEILTKIDGVTPCRYGAPVVLVVAFDKNNVFTYPGGKRDSGVEDATIVATHMILAAADEGVDSCWINFFDPDKMAEAGGDRKLSLNSVSPAASAAGEFRSRRTIELKAGDRSMEKELHKLAVIFPGIGYTADKPLLYFGRRIAVEYGYEVRIMDYKGFPPKVKGDRNRMEESFFIALRQAEEMLAGVDFYTPLEDTFRFPIGEAIAFTGDDDPWVGKENSRIPALCKERGIPCRLVPHANHSLESKDVFADMKELRKVMKETEAFLE